MKIKTPQGKIVNVSIQKGQGGNLTLTSEEAAGLGIKGQVLKATKHEIDILKSAPSIGITVDDDFIASDEK
jgi:hypothetical protein